MENFTRFPSNKMLSCADVSLTAQNDKAKNYFKKKEKEKSKIAIQLSTFLHGEGSNWTAFQRLWMISLGPW